MTKLGNYATGFARDSLRSAGKERMAATNAPLPITVECADRRAEVGSPPFPHPRLIRPTVRRLLRSPRLSGPGTHHAAFCSSLNF
jgi:hypothetical protein